MVGHGTESEIEHSMELEPFLMTLVMGVTTLKVRLGTAWSLSHC